MVVTRCEETVKGNKCFHTLSCLLYICGASNISLSTVSSFTGLLNAARSQAVNVRACVCVCRKREIAAWAYHTVSGWSGSWLGNQRRSNRRGFVMLWLFQLSWEIHALSKIQLISAFLKEI